MSTELPEKMRRCRIIGSREPRAAARPPASGIRHRVRPVGARRRPPRLRRPPGTALPPLSRRHDRVGAVAAEPRLVGGLRRAPVLPTRGRVAGRRDSPGLDGRGRRSRGVSGGALDRVGPPRHGHLCATDAASRQRLARPARGFHGADALGGIPKRCRGGPALGARRRAARLGAAAPRGALARELGRGRPAGSSPGRASRGRGHPPPSPLTRRPRCCWLDWAPGSARANGRVDWDRRRSSPRSASD